MTAPLITAPEVGDALDAGEPVVALETTLVTHGLPEGEGLRVAAALEAEVRMAGAVPATIGVLEGAVRVGLTPRELEQLARSGAAKLSLANLAAHVASGQAGSTTVAATLFAAHHAGIRVFATGGIGGVHRDAGESGDVSADLFSLARFPVAVVCAGAKAVLDLAKTVEMLETLGVPVYGFGTDRFPAFYRRDSGLPVDRRFDNVEELAAATGAHFRLGVGTGVVVANPIAEEHEMPEAQYEEALRAVLAEAGAAHLRGRAITPFLLDRMCALTGGASVAANRALLLSNARVAGALAVALAGRTRALASSRSATI